ncbi:hypothetical protein C1Y40_03820 [Mycobacterium talmoniae]|uniref:Uncharacterized protein n=2 Tax=Mycobacterium talmoniae TaxID=1858794 RepID=A0A1S1NKH6_9MYCO|nr:hypothetical protein BKN37_00760 [Mycobacterium talmoniae]PQM46020.1 hypothetical protein C1Y40_03820 [Mycobacterium talmoniae]
MMRMTTAAVLAGISAIAAGTTARLLTSLTNDVAFALEGVLDEDWGGPCDGDARNATDDPVVLRAA